MRAQYPGPIDQDRRCSKCWKQDQLCSSFPLDGERRCVIANQPTLLLPTSLAALEQLYRSASRLAPPGISAGTERNGLHPKQFRHARMAGDRGTRRPKLWTRRLPAPHARRGGQPSEWIEASSTTDIEPRSRIRPLDRHSGTSGRFA